MLKQNKQLIIMVIVALVAAIGVFAVTQTDNRSSDSVQRKPSSDVSSEDKKTSPESSTSTDLQEEQSSDDDEVDSSSDDSQSADSNADDSDIRSHNDNDSPPQADNGDRQDSSDSSATDNTDNDTRQANTDNDNSQGRNDNDSQENTDDTIEAGDNDSDEDDSLVDDNQVTPAPVEVDARWKTTFRSFRCTNFNQGMVSDFVNFYQPSHKQSRPSQTSLLNGYQRCELIFNYRNQTPDPIEVNTCDDIGRLTYLTGENKLNYRQSWVFDPYYNCAFVNQTVAPDQTILKYATFIADKNIKFKKATFNGGVHNLNYRVGQSPTDEDFKWKGSVGSIQCGLVDRSKMFKLQTKRIRRYFNDESLKPAIILTRLQFCDVEFTYKNTGPGSTVREALIDTSPFWFSDQSYVLIDTDGNEVRVPSWGATMTKLSGDGLTTRYQQNGTVDVKDSFMVRGKNIKFVSVKIKDGTVIPLPKYTIKANDDLIGP